MERKPFFSPSSSSSPPAKTFEPFFSPSSTSSSSSSPPAKTFDVFLSFRGEDTRNNFTGHLSLALRKIGLFNIFKDDYALDKGKEIGPELMKAIEDSQYAVVVLSEKYATSSWCLKELAKIVECMGDSGRIRTIFYHVDPSHVRNHKESFGEALKKHENDPRYSSEEVQSWRKALTKVANQSGEPVESHTDEATFIKEFVAKISNELGASIRTTEGLFGIIARLMKLDSYVRQSSATNTVCFIGIHGMGGIGKSTLARAYQKKMSHQFDGSSFLQDVREVCLQKASGLVDLQKQLLEDILKDKFEWIRHVDDGRDMIRSRLRNKKVLIILDDVSNEEQLNALAEEYNWFGSESIIIVTTREDSFLKIRKYAIYKAEYLTPIEALQLFSWKAFRSIEPPDQEYKELSEQVVKYASYLPLALTVLGSLLGSKEKSLWNGALRRLSEVPEEKIVEKLKISFDDLNPTDEHIFLDIACFYNRGNTDEVMEILDSCWFDLKYGISNLVGKSLLSIDEDKYGTSKIWMHDLLEEMGKDIVRKKSDNELVRQSRIWDPVDFCQILENKKGTDKIEAIVTCVDDTNITEYGVEALSHMEKLRLLVIHLDFHEKYGGLDNFDELDDCDCDGLELSNSLQYILWSEFPYNQLPSSFQPLKLVQLILWKSNIKQLWNNCAKTLYNLKVIDLSSSESFTKFEDFTVFPNLEKLILFHCSKLSEIHPSIKHLKKLIVLDLKYCISLEKLPEEIIDLASLQTLNLGACSKLEKLPDNLEQLKSLRNLVIERSGIEHLPSSIFLMENLESVDLSSERVIMSNIKENIIGYRTTGNSFMPGWVCTSLTKLELIDCNLTGPEAFPEYFSKLVCLRHLDLSRNPFSVLPAGIKGFTDLTSLKLDHCKSLGCLEAELLPSSLLEVHVSYCSSLTSFLDPLKPCHLRSSVVSCLDCTELVKRQDGKITALASLTRFLEVEDPPRRICVDFRFVVPQSDNELPPWFINQSSTSSIRINLDPNWRYSGLIGVAMVFCFRANPYTQDRFSCNIRVRCSTNWITIPSLHVEIFNCRMSDHLFLAYSPFQYAFKFIEQLGPQSCVDTLEFSFLRAYDDEFSFLRAYDVYHSSCGPCGVRLVYEKDIEELKQITNNYQKDELSSHTQSISQLSKLRLMEPIGWPLWTGLRGILDVDDNLELFRIQRYAYENRLFGDSVIKKINFGVFRNYTGVNVCFRTNRTIIDSSSYNFPCVIYN